MSLKGKKPNKYITAFLLFVSITVCSLSLCVRLVISNPATFSDVFTDSEYVIAIRADVLQYAKDMCDKSSIPQDFLETAISYDTITQLNKAYVSNALDNSKQYNSVAYSSKLNSFRDNLVKSVNAMLKEQKIKIAKGQEKSGAVSFADEIAEYASSRIEFKFMDDLVTVLKHGRLWTVIISAATVVSSLIFATTIMFTSSKKYRGLRKITYAVTAAAIFDSLMLLAVAVVRAAKDLVIYPTYLADAFMRYVNQSMLSVAFAVLVLVLITLALVAAIWKMKRDEEE